MKEKIHNHLPALSILFLLLAVSALVYLPLVSRLGYYYDDWYLMYAAHAHGPLAFKDVFSVDRPLRAYVMGPAYTLFGENPLFYNLSACFFRYLSALGLLWVLHMLWPKQRTATTLMALLFLIYPGFLSQINGIDYQSQMVSLAAGLFSIALSVRAILTARIPFRAAFIVMSILLGWFYLGLVEYFMGFELLRFLCILLIAWRSREAWIKKIARAVYHWLPMIVIPMGFLLWRVFMFENQRGATDLGRQFGNFSGSPFVTGLWWLVRLLDDTLNVLLMAWGVPLYQFFNQLRLRDISIGLTIAAIVITLVILFYKRTEKDEIFGSTDWRNEAIWLGLGGVIAGMIPITLVNRHVSFPAYSRYTLASSVGAMIALTALLYYIASRRLRLALVSTFLLIATLTHYANAVKASQKTASMNAFWWQVSWRIPQMWKNTTLVVNYQRVTTEEDYIIWGPANLIYYPESVNERFIQPGIYAAILNKDNVIKILTRHRQQFDNGRTIRTYKNFRNILVLTQPTTISCVQVIDGKQLELSTYEDENIMLIAPYSKADLILLNEPFHIPPETIFGPEPPHEWCYYYEKGALARQAEDWETIANIGEEALEKGSSPKDKIEWMPFLQAYAYLGK